ncbi:MAG: [Fe-Fe] hydrogenase large subunit C-terminal domain-containing protein [Clostridiaceae bacterium]|jgi:iron only hydrogenase large subunit-like protein|nr:[Fe-Fe] hydrogenase large subunit C-terminal domain-containing protein [Clostridiaceae bacterium]
MEEKYFHSVVLNEGRCIGCTSCLKVCPTEAIRLKKGKARIIGEKCIDCGECIRICPNHAKNAITDTPDILKKYRYTIAIPSLVLYGQFSGSVGINEVLTAVKKIGFDEVFEISAATEIITNVIKNHILKNPGKRRPVINSSCPATLRLIQIRFPELLPNIADIETPIEIAARLAKTEAARKTGFSMDEIGVIYISPCTARMTSAKHPIGIKRSYIDGVLSMKDVYGMMLRNLNNSKGEDETRSTRESLLWPITGGQGEPLGIENYLAVDGISEVIKVLEEIEMDKLSGLEFFEGMACVGGCAGGPLTIENPFIARSRMKALAKGLPNSNPTEEEIKAQIEMYKDGFIRLTEPIEPRAVMRLDDDISKSIKKMEKIKEILKNLPGIDCGVCGAPTCKAFAEDIVKGENQDAVCIVKTMKSFNNNEKV